MTTTLAPRAATDKDSPFHVPGILDALGGLVSRFPGLWLAAGKLESGVLAAELAAVPLVKPIYVCGLARSGSTLLHEAIASHPRVATHRMKDYPFISTPYWWRRATAPRAGTAVVPRERSHRDRMMVTPESPDALEEMLWMAFFPGCHDPACDNRLTASVRNPPFEAYYRDHVRKLLLAERATRYAAKANYHVARLQYLLRLIPDARIVIPVRSPVGHITSLVRQHAWFSAGHRKSRKSLMYMRRSGHFEFGLDRRPINLGDHARVREIQKDWAMGDEIPGWAKYWDMVYRYLAVLLASDAVVRAAVVVVRFEDLCERPAEVLAQVLTHCDLPDPDAVVARMAPKVRRPDYYDSPLSDTDRATIRSYTAETAELYGV